MKLIDMLTILIRFVSLIIELVQLVISFFKKD